MESLSDLCIDESVEFEKCVVSQFRTTSEQRQLFEEHLSTCDMNEIPIEWVIDIADESSGWYYGTAYHYNDSTRMLHVMVPDKVNPTFDGLVALDFRTVHLIECADKNSEALFNKIIRDSIIKVKWSVEWLEEEISTNDSEQNESQGKWIASTARYCIRIANQLLIEEVGPQNDDQSGIPNYVMVAADLNVKLVECHKGKGIEDFQRLISDNTTLFTPEAEKYAQSYVSTQRLSRQESLQSSLDTTESGATLASRLSNVRKLAELTRTLKDSVEDIVEEGHKIYSARVDYAKVFQNFALNGDLDAGLQLFSEMKALLRTADKDSPAQEVASPSRSTSPNQRADHSNIAYSALADEAVTLVQKLEKGMHKLIKTTETQEFEAMRRAQLLLRKQLESKEKEIKRLRAAKT